MDINHARARAIQSSIARVLYERWDPLSLSGIAPRDEYDTYVGRIYRSLCSCREREQIVSELWAIECEYMGMTERDEVRLSAAADALLALDIAVEH